MCLSPEARSFKILLCWPFSGTLCCACTGWVFPLGFYVAPCFRALSCSMTGVAEGLTPKGLTEKALHPCMAAGPTHQTPRGTAGGRRDPLGHPPAGSVVRQSLEGESLCVCGVCVVCACVCVCCGGCRGDVCAQGVLPTTSGRDNPQGIHRQPAQLLP